MGRQLPSAERPGSELYIHHEAIPDFKDAAGNRLDHEIEDLGLSPGQPERIRLRGRRRPPGDALDPGFAQSGGIGLALVA